MGGEEVRMNGWMDGWNVENEGGERKRTDGIGT